jgi:hypothetical protein
MIRSFTIDGKVVDRQRRNDGMVCAAVAFRASRNSDGVHWSRAIHV